MNILHVVNISFVIPFFLGKQLNYFSSKGYKEYVVCSPSEELKLFSERYSFESYPVKILRKFSIANDIKSVIRIYHLIKEKNIDIVNGHTPKGALLAMTAAFLAKVPKRIYFRHGLVYETSKGFKRWFLLNIDRVTSALSTNIVCVSPSVAIRSVEDNLNNEKKQKVLHHGTCNGIDFNHYDKSCVDTEQLTQLKRRIGVLEKDFVIGYAGRMVRDKGLIELVDAFQLIKKTIPNAKLLLIGMLEERDALPENTVRLMKEDDNIIMTGYVDHEDMPLYYAIMCVFVLPSYREGFPTSILEASSMQLPVVTANVTGCKDAIIEGKTGVFVHHQPEDIAYTLIRHYERPDLRKEMGQMGRIFVEDNFNPQVIWDEIEKIYLT